MRSALVTPAPAVLATPVRAAAYMLGRVVAFTPAPAAVCTPVPAGAYMPALAAECMPVPAAVCMPGRVVAFTLAPAVAATRGHLRNPAHAIPARGVRASRARKARHGQRKIAPAESYILW